MTLNKRFASLKTHLHSFWVTSKTALSLPTVLATPKHRGSSCGMVGRAKGVGQGTVVLYTNRVVQACNDLAVSWIKWPTATERRCLSSMNSSQYGFEDCVLSTDGTHIVLFEKPDTRR
ncbi:hypothetical protein Ae201684P_009993 [Aphanomyces euteiches]|nr:hypothetical protein Ae201684P_009993 [Aphanomyces euteiches]